MKHTAKFRAALTAANKVFKKGGSVDARRDNASLYAALEKRGWFWDLESGSWLDHKRSTSIFEDDNGLPTGVFRVRVMAHPGQMDRAMEIVYEALDTYGVTIEKQSEPDPNRNGKGVRVYLSCKLPDGSEE